MACDLPTALFGAVYPTGASSSPGHPQNSCKISSKLLTLKKGKFWVLHLDTAALAVCIQQGTEAGEQLWEET